MVEVLIFVGDGVQINVLCAEMEYWCVCYTRMLMVGWFGRVKTWLEDFKGPQQG